MTSVGGYPGNDEAGKALQSQVDPTRLVNDFFAAIEFLQGHEASLVDPQSREDQQPAYAKNAARAIKAEIFVAIGICTHLGCSPSGAPKGANNPSLPADWPGGFFCPCHGSTFDGAGRVFKNKPAPTNLEIPPHRYASDTRILIGDDAAA